MSDNPELKCSNPECGALFDIVSKALFDWDKCDLCGSVGVPNPAYRPTMPNVVVKGGATFAPAKSPARLKKEAGRLLRRKKLDILKGKGSVVEKDLAIEKLKTEARADEYHSGAFAFDVPRTMDAELKPEIKPKYMPVCSPEPAAKPKPAKKSA